MEERAIPVEVVDPCFDFPPKAPEGDFQQVSDKGKIIFIFSSSCGRKRISKGLGIRINEGNSGKGRMRDKDVGYQGKG